jgi:hypothetical protein
LVFPTSQCGFQRDGGLETGRREVVVATESRSQDVCASAAAEHIIFKTSTEE